MNRDRGAALVAIARAALDESFGLVVSREPADEPWLRELGATFVTLTKNGELRGCIGSVTASKPLIDDLRANARAAAFRDPRFPPVTADELPSISVEVSVLSPVRELTFDGERHLLELLEPGVDGLVIEADGRRATFLPQVWESLRDPASFLAQLKRKAGLDPEESAEGLRAWRFRVEKFTE